MTHGKHRKRVWNVICDVCGFEFKSDQVRMRWDNLIVCKEDWEPRHQQDFIRAVEEKIVPDFVRPVPADVFVDVNYNTSLFYCDVVKNRGVAGYGVAGCMTPRTV